MSKTIDVSSLPPGFIVINYDPEKVDPDTLLADEKLASDWEKRGYFGGVILPNGVKVSSLSDSDLAALGLQKIPAKEGKKK